MNLYLTRHQYGNTHTEDLWSALEEASSKPIKRVMPTWTRQKGYPVITIESCVHEPNNVRTLVVRQSKFTVDLSDQGNIIFLLMDRNGNFEIIATNIIEYSFTLQMIKPLGWFLYRSANNLTQKRNVSAPSWKDARVKYLSLMCHPMNGSK